MTNLITEARALIEALHAGVYDNEYVGAGAHEILTELCDALENTEKQLQEQLDKTGAWLEEYNEMKIALEQAQATLEQTWEWDMYKAAQKEIERLRKELEQAQNAQRWIPIAEQMPENCGIPLMLVGTNGYGQKRVFEGFTGYCRRGTLLFHSNCRDVNIDNWDITHWMPLPAPPKEGVEKSDAN